MENMFPHIITSVLEKSQFVESQCGWPQYVERLAFYSNKEDTRLKKEAKK